jgi:hypothetical protein
LGRSLSRAAGTRLLGDWLVDATYRRTVRRALSDEPDHVSEVLVRKASTKIDGQFLGHHRRDPAKTGPDGSSAGGAVTKRSTGRREFAMKGLTMRNSREAA